MRSTKHYDPNIFKSKLESQDWASVFNSKDVDAAWCNFKKTYVDILDEVAPLKQVRIKQNTEIWMNNEILNAIRNRDKLLFKYRKTGCETIYANYKIARNKTPNLVKKTKASYFKDQIQEN